MARDDQSVKSSDKNTQSSLFKNNTNQIILQPTNSTPVSLSIPGHWGELKKLTSFWRKAFQSSDVWTFIDPESPQLQLCVASIKLNKKEPPQKLIEQIAKKIFSITMPVKINSYRTVETQNRDGYKGLTILTEGDTKADSQQDIQLQWISVITKNQTDYWVIYMTNAVKNELKFPAFATDNQIMSGILSNFHEYESKS
ncbi:hypothetical protein KS4_20680 [Poriferisphaera corsica]|uniref:Uncharacterized protein n=1 Tax=Poriferisphaera corsica TaxID=2528020 RepID=A0A517YUV4_9BACT|nr:hypothetical protein [Poriferisphaera corsica]QDU34007.1 hypothetical protein KS4_20680 [Poriferisphaera corsica]